MPSQHHMMTKRAAPRPPRPTQAGVAVLGVTVVLLLVLSVMGLYANRAIWLEQKATGNQYRSKQALEAAEAGLEYMVAVLSVKTSNTAADELYDYLSKDTATGRYNVVNGATLVRSPAAGQVFSVVISRIPGGAAENTPPTKRFLLTSTGGSDCSDTTSLSSCQSRALARLKVRLTGPMANPPDSGLVVRDQVTLSGSSCVVNNTGAGKAVRTGKSNINVTGGGGGGGGSSSKGCTGSNTTILDNNQNAGSCSGANPNTSCTDPTIATLDGDQFFNLYFGSSKTAVKSGASFVLTDTEPTPPSSGELVWVDITNNSFNINGNVTYGSSVDPAILILNGDVRITGNVTIYGVIYISGKLTLTGTLNIEGAVVVEGIADVGGNAQIAKNQGVLNALAGGQPPIMKLMGSWKDW